MESWRGDYWNNPDLAGEPVLIRNEAEIDFDWGEAGPAAVNSTLPPDNFSARWTRTLNFAEGYYRFTVDADDGARLFIDENLLINDWQSDNPNPVSNELFLANGQHKLRLDYFERAGPAHMRLQWEALGAAASGLASWRGSYFRGTDLTGEAALVRADPAIDFRWTESAPITMTEGLAVRWERTVDFAAGRYRFTAEATGGLRFWIDNKLVIDRWQEELATQQALEIYLTPRTYQLRVDYFHSGAAPAIRFEWVRTE